MRVPQVPRIVVAECPMPGTDLAGQGKQLGAIFEGNSCAAR